MNFSPLLKRLESMAERHVRVGSILNRCYAFAWRHMPALIRAPRLVIRDGLKIYVRPLVASDWHIVDDAFEKLELAHFSPREGDLVVDIGANIGLYTLIACRAVGPHGRVISIEPDESNFVLLTRSIRANGFTNALALPMGLGSQTGNAYLYEGLMPTGSTLRPSSDRLAHRTRGVRKVPVTTLASVLERLGLDDVDWIKVDVEGSDLEVLRGGQECLMGSKRARVLIEVSSEETLKYLSYLGFSIRHISGADYMAFKETPDSAPAGGISSVEGKA